MSEQTTPEIKRLSCLVAGEKIFESSGISTVKTTKEGLEVLLEIPIKSTGVSEFMSELSGKAPQPPVKKILIKKGSPEAKELGLSHDKFVQIFDSTDEEYVNRLEIHNQDFTWRVAIFAMNLKWMKADGSEAATFEDKKQILKDNGITWSQINQIFSDVSDLTRLREDREDFLPVS